VSLLSNQKRNKLFTAKDAKNAKDGNFAESRKERGVKASTLNPES